MRTDARCTGHASLHEAFRKLLPTVLAVFTMCFGACAIAQQIPLGPLAPPASGSGSLLTSTTSPGTAFLFDLEHKMAAAVAKGGGAAFASFFDKDGMTLANRQLPVIGQAAIAVHAKWLPTEYSLTWTPDGGELSPDGDMGYTWGHYEGRVIGPGSNNTVERGRYVTVWKKEPDGTWKILIDSSNEEPPDCQCSVDAKP